VHPIGIAVRRFIEDSPMIKRFLKIALVIVSILILIALGLMAYYFGRVAPLIKAGKQQGIYSAASSRPIVAEFGFETLNGGHQSVASFKGNVVVIDVWATWCGTCLANIPNIVKLRNVFRDKPVEIIGVDVDDDGWAKVKPFLQKHPEINYTLAIPYPASSFQLKTVVDLKPLGNVSAIPTLFVVDRQGRLAGKFIELGHEQEIENLVSKLLIE
jgi:thiol-disulfide isomerase/thioredoxin